MITEIQPSNADPFAASRRSIKIRTVVLTSLVIIALTMGIYFYSRSRQSSLVIQSPSSNITIKLNGSQVSVENDKQGLRVPVIAGEYRLEIDRTNYLPFIQDVTIPVGQNLVIRPVFTLMPITAEQTAGGGISFVRPVPNGNLVFYLGDGGTRLYRVDTAAQTQLPISEQSISPITDVEWPSSANVALVTRSDGTYLFEVPKFDFQTQTFEKVASTAIISPVWDPNKDRIAAALFLPDGEHTLVLADKRFSSLDRKADLTGFTNPRIIWSPQSRFIAVLNRSADSAQNNVWIYTMADGTFTAVTNSGDITDVSFSPDERTILLEKSGSSLLTHDLAGGDERKVSTAGTVALAAWRDGTSFYLPEPGSNALTLHTVGGTSTQIPYTLPGSGTIKGMFYFSQSDSLVFYTESAVYTVSMAQ